MCQQSDNPKLVRPGTRRRQRSLHLATAPGAGGLALSICLLPALAQETKAPATEAAPIIQPGAPGTPSKRLPAGTRPTAPQTSEADIDFTQGMIMHHSQAVEMTALIPSHTENEAIRTLGARISRSQSDEINFMKRWLTVRGEPTTMAMPGMPDMDKHGKPMQAMPGMLTPEQMAALRQARGAEFDRLFLAGMIQHHNGALIMVQQLFEAPGAGQDADLFDFATDADNTQRAEIRIMQGMLRQVSKQQVSQHSTSQHPASQEKQ